MKNQWHDSMVACVSLAVFAFMSAYFNNPWFMLAGVLVPWVMP